MKRITITIIAVMVLQIAAQSPGVIAADKNSTEGIPAGAVKATMRNVIDGDKIKVLIGKKTENVLLSGIDAPEKGECFFDETVKNMKSLLSQGDTVYLESSSDDEDGDGRLLRYVWIPGEDGDKASLLNTKLVREGFAGFDDQHDSPKYFERLRELVVDAREKEVGVWGDCNGRLHLRLSATEVPEREPEDEPEDDAPTIGFSAEERAYAAASADLAGQGREAIEDLSELLANPQPNDAWIISTAARLVTLQLVYEDALALSPPEAFQSVHVSFLEGTRLWSQGADIIIAALDAGDSENLTFGAMTIAEGSERLSEAAEEVERLTEERGA